jgi:hypothetical protein
MRASSTLADFFASFGCGLGLSLFAIFTPHLPGFGRRLLNHAAVPVARHAELKSPVKHDLFIPRMTKLGV